MRRSERIRERLDACEQDQQALYEELLGDRPRLRRALDIANGKARSEGPEELTQIQATVELIKAIEVLEHEARKLDRAFWAARDQERRERVDPPPPPRSAPEEAWELPF